MSEKLLPCPFCGEPQIFFNALDEDESENFRASINCPACLVSMPREVNNDAELINCWNTRTPQPKLPSAEDVAKVIAERHRGFGATILPGDLDFANEILYLIQSSASSGANEGDA